MKLRICLIAHRSGKQNKKRVIIWGLAFFQTESPSLRSYLIIVVLVLTVVGRSLARKPEKNKVDITLGYVGAQPPSFPVNTIYQWFFQSPRIAVAVLSTIPAVLTGVAISLWVTRTTLNVQSFMGAIMAIGVSVANAILLITFAEASRGQIYLEITYRLHY